MLQTPCMLVSGPAKFNTDIGNIAGLPNFVLQVEDLLLFHWIRRVESNILNFGDYISNGV